ncbi:MAG: hypothetical protein CVV64_04420 [Candidatus Wallbacteria bacterium HGW-Wallbacteria-1]|uniref:Uncharacterized protein n=1 Tax=Candidatus Wallbacteria bacterium HGW-Wallbacteria-1 TaxID=2013854 RepID=A0A2N1PRX3_9BACT|nr:MAG: hypothetical protein CVV64_04420 [Candidatus Wallbacteria bacterium HGW-Wallbacteria-1]
MKEFSHRVKNRKNGILLLLVVMFYIVIDSGMALCMEKSSPTPYPCLAIRKNTVSNSSEMILLSGNRTAHLFTAAEIKTPVFSRDLKSIFFSCNASGSMEIWSLDLETRESRQLTKHGKGFAAFNPSPDSNGDYIVYSLAGPLMDSESNISSDPAFSPSSIWYITLSDFKSSSIISSPQFDNGPVIRFTQPRVAENGEYIIFTRSSLPFRGAISFDSMEVMKTTIRLNNNRLVSDSMEKLAGGNSGYTAEGESLGYMALCASPMMDGSVIFLASEGRTDTRIMNWKDGKIREIINSGNEIFTAPTARGENILLAAIGEDGRKWVMYSTVTGQRVVVTDESMEYVGF